MDEFLGAELVNLRLLALTKEERLLLSPNLEPHGLKTLASPHGLVLVAVAGTIHRDAACLGVFEQVFGLIRSPMDDSWKIKFVNLKIRGQDALGGPEVTAPALSYNSSDLHRLCSWWNSFFDISYPVTVSVALLHPYPHEKHITTVESINCFFGHFVLKILYLMLKSFASCALFTKPF